MFGLLLGLILGATTCCGSVSTYIPPSPINAIGSVEQSAYFSTVKLQVTNPGKTVAIVASGFPIDNDTIITAGHFCMNAYMGAITGELVEGVEVVYVNRNNELAVMSGGQIDAINEKMDLCVIKRPKHGVVPFKLDSKKVQVHDEVVVVGAPAGFFPVTEVGRVIMPSTRDFPIVDLNDRLALSVSGTSGNSGGPVLNDQGEVIGVVMAKLGSYDKIMIAVKLDTIKQFLVEEYGK